MYAILLKYFSKSESDEWCEESKEDFDYIEYSLSKKCNVRMHDLMCTYITFSAETSSHVYEKCYYFSVTVLSC